MQYKTFLAWLGTVHACGLLYISTSEPPLLHRQNLGINYLGLAKSRFEYALPHA